MTAAKQIGSSKPAAKKAAPAKGAAARGEVVDGPAAKTIDFRGLSLTLPEKMSAAVLMDIGMVQDDSDIGAAMRLLESLLGQQQIRAVRTKILDDAVPVDEFGEVVSDLFDKAFGAYGMKPGEAQASPAS